uniref:Uncharacterized protein n=1 Tax=Anopheles albimanus TaxID=7167 RepID=A0A182FHY7_ANOAL
MVAVGAPNLCSRRPSTTARNFLHSGAGQRNHRLTVASNGDDAENFCGQLHPAPGKGTEYRVATIPTGVMS